MTEILTVQQFINRFERFAPRKFAMPGDPIGLHFGHPQQAVHKILVTLDVRPEVVDEAIEIGADFIFSHHPPLFKPAATLAEDNPQQAMYAKIIRHDIAVYAAHTNLDAAPDGMNDWLADLYQIQDTEVLAAHTQINYYRVVVFVPDPDLTRLTAALAAQGFGCYGNYDNVGFYFPGTGTFKPNQQANPTVGQAGSQEFVAETAYTLMCSETELAAALALIREVHPYEEPVVDVYPLENQATAIGLGRIGNLAEPMPFADYAELVKQKTGVSGLRIVASDTKRLVKRVAVLGGDGGKYYPAALAKGADTFITGDIYYHVAHDMLAGGLNAIDPGHHFESICKEKLARLFTAWSATEKWPVTVTFSQLNTDPYTFI